MAKETEVSLNSSNIGQSKPDQFRPDEKSEKSAEIPSRPNLIEQAKQSSPSELVDLLISKNQDEILPWETCTLPSMGLYYDGRVPDGKVEVRPLGLTADKILATARLTQSGQALDYVYKNHVRFPDKNFNSLDLLSGDRIFLLFYLRGITHGNIYEFSVKCTNDACGIMSTHEYDLMKLQGTFRNAKHAKHPKEPIKIILPHMSKIVGREFWVEARFMRGSDLQAMARKRKFDEKITGKAVRSAKFGEDMSSERVVLDRTIEENLNLMILNVNGVSDRQKVSEVIKRMSAKDTSTVRRVLDEDAPGMDTEIVVTCPNCDTEMRMELPITESFFRPQNSGGIR